MSGSLEELEAMRAALEALETLDDEGRSRALRWIGDSLGVTEAAPESEQISGTSDSSPPLQIGDLTAKQFMAQKRPTTTVERVTCLAFFLTYGKQTPHFKTRDLTEMNREAAGATFSNIAQAAKDAVRANYLAPAGKGARQISVLGEEVVNALPDREAVRKVVIAGRTPRRRKGGGRAKKA